MFFLCFGSALLCLLMACVNNNNSLDHPSFKHYCRVCKKGFMCGRALGGHMRAHGIGDDAAALDDADDASDWEDKFDRNNSSKRMYQLRTNPNRLKSCKTCENCGKEFLSWKSFLEHGNGKCASDDAASDEATVVSSDDGEDDGRRSGWSKRKRSLRSKVGSTTSEEEDLLLATCLVQLANTTVDLEAEESSASAGKEEERRSAYFATSSAAPPPKTRAKAASNSPRGLFECKACKKVFNSHQALGGHRASHKKVKGCYAAKQDDPDESAAPPPAAAEKDDQDFFPSQKAAAAAFQFDQGQAPLVGAARRKSKVHECSICHRVFNSGQALGGHKRCHWIISNSPDPKFQYQEHHENNNKGGNADVAAGDRLDLNVPAWAHMSGVRRDPRNPLSFEVSTDMHLRPWMGARAPANNNNNNNNDNNNGVSEKGKGEVGCHVEDEADSKLKLAKLSDLSDANVGSSQWLQVGIGSAATEAAAAAAGDV